MSGVGRRRRDVAPMAMAVLLIAIGGASCGDLMGPPEATLLMVDGNRQPGARAGTELPHPLFVRLVDDAGDPIAGVPVTWVVSSEGGTIEPGMERTDSDGYAWAKFHAGPAAALQTVQATASGRSVTFEFDVAPAEAARLAFGGDSLVVDALGDTLVLDIRAEDGYGNRHPLSEIALVSSDTTVIALLDGALVSRGNGQALVLAQIHDLTDTLTVTVRQVVRTITLEAGTSLAPDDRTRILPVDRRGQEVAGHGATFTSSAPAVLSVEDDGRVHALALGSGVLAAEWADGRATVEVTVLPLTSTRVTTGGGHTCVLNGAGAVYCWGLNDTGQLGYGTGDQACGLRHISTAWPCSTTPRQVPTSIAFTQVEAGFGHTCGLTAEGVAYCWGSNAYGQLGVESVADECEPAPWGGWLVPCSHTPVLVGTDQRFVALTAGLGSTCALTNDGEAWCWGANDSGQTGRGTRSGGEPRPEPVLDGHRFVQLATGGGQTCGLAADGLAHCWGTNQAGELGDGTTEPRTRPVPVLGGHEFAALGTGREHTCGVTSAGVTYCWGANHLRQLGANFGDAYWAFSAVPMLVENAPQFRDVAPGHVHTCGLTPESNLHCWGTSYQGQLGVEAVETATSPIPSAAGLTFRWVSAAIGGHVCGLRSTGDLYCWGSNELGALGLGDTTDRWVPQRVVGPW